MRRKAKVPATVPADWTIEHEIVVNGRHVQPGTEVSIEGERGRFRFVKQVTTPTATWIDVVGGPAKSERFRSFRPDRVRTVHWKNTTRANLV